MRRYRLIYNGRRRRTTTTDDDGTDDGTDDDGTDDGTDGQRTDDESSDPEGDFEQVRSGSRTRKPETGIWNLAGGRPLRRPW